MGVEAQEVCNLLSMSENQVIIVDEIIELMTKENKLLNNIII